jgi:hypothetical protein
MLKRNKLNFEGHYTQIPNKWVRDHRLSYRARGILAILMSHDVGWRTSQNQLQTEHDGRDAIAKSIRELEAFGYLVREQGHDESGRFQEVIWILNDPFDSPLTDLPLTAKPLTVKQPTKKNNIKKPNDKEFIATNKQSFSTTWKPTEDQLATIKDQYPSANIDKEIEAMIDYILAAGKEKDVKDMAARFRTWLRNADKYAKGALSKDPYNGLKRF